MNTITTAARKTVRRFLVLLAAAVAALGVTLGTAAPSQAANPVWEGSLGVNSYYGWVSSNVYLDYYSQTSLSFGITFRDNRTDNLCTVVHARGVYQNNSTTGWAKVGTSCSTTGNSYGTRAFTAPYGYYFSTAQVRVCQSDRYGNVIGTCSGAVSPQSWRIIYV